MRGFPTTARSPTSRRTGTRSGARARRFGRPTFPCRSRSAGGGGETVSDRVKEYLSEKSPWWWNKWYKVKAAYRDADEAVGLTEFIKSRPVELAKDAATEYVEWRLGKYGKSVTTGLKIQGAVKSTGDEVGEILVAAPQVIAHGSGAEARKLYDRADRVPLKLSNDLFDEVTGKFPMPRYESGVAGWRPAMIADRGRRIGLACVLLLLPVAARLADGGPGGEDRGPQGSRHLRPRRSVRLRRRPGRGGPRPHPGATCSTRDRGNTFSGIR